LPILQEIKTKNEMKKTMKNLVTVFALSASLASSTKAQTADDLAAPIRNQVSNPDKPFSNLIEITIIPGKEKEFEKLFGPVIAKVRKEQGCIEFQLSKHPKESNVYFLYERWKNIRILEEHMILPHMTEFWPKYFSLIARIPDIRVFIVNDLQ
jgi:quinol monooxygenase YgiN